MKYNAPYGSADPDAAYVDRNTPAAIKGSPVPAKAIEMPQREIVAVINAAGIMPSNDDPTQLLQALQALISGITGGAGDPNYVLMTQARVRLPIFPEVLTSDGKLPCTSPATGTVRVPAGYNFLHRGIYNVTTVETDFATAANKTYHLRWNSSSGYALKDLADTGYNPSALAETDTSFDSIYDDMLIAKVVTNASNVSTITNLVNSDRLASRLTLTGQNMRPASYATERMFDFSGTLNWARTPTMAAFNWARKYSSATTTIGDSDHFIVAYGGSYNSAKLERFPYDRYSTAFAMLHDDLDTTLEIIYDTLFSA